MIGVIGDLADREIVEEFFELFKTPWEFFRIGRSYDVVLDCAGSDSEVETCAKLCISYANRKRNSQVRQSIGRMVLNHGRQIPIYGDCNLFPASTDPFLVDQVTQQSAGYIEKKGESTKAHIGFNLFHEIRYLLTIGQPAANAAIPTLELHIALLRNLIVKSGILLTEIPPVPEGYKFIACLTHDVDHPSIRQHKFDHTVLGFLLRATIGTLAGFLSGRTSLRKLLKNWVAAIKLPLVSLGLAKDFWRDFDRQYLAIEGGLPSTFFVIPFKNRPGQMANGSAPEFRSAGYGAREIADSIKNVHKSGCEVGLHGIDAWCDSSAGLREMSEIRKVTGDELIGIRMHWLYFDEASPQHLEDAGAAYDSTVGYNETVGYRAGTTQVYKLLGTHNLLELPLHVMDTAMFYPTHMGLSLPEAKKALEGILDNAAEFGGCITVNWHDRSLAPERLWDDTYRVLLNELKARGAWCVTASQAVSWFQHRRSIAFPSDNAGSAITDFSNSPQLSSSVA